MSVIKLAPRPTGYDPVKDAHDRLKAAKVDVADVQVMTNTLLLLPHKLPDKTAGGIILADRTRDEDRWQGKVALVLKVGPTAFVDDEVNKFGGNSVKPGEWVVTRATDGYEVQLGGRSEGVVCKLVQDTHVRMVVKDPDMVF